MVKSLIIILLAPFLVFTNELLRNDSSKLNGESIADTACPVLDFTVELLFSFYICVLYIAKDVFLKYLLNI